MKIIEATTDATLPGSVVAVGSFDGVHRGHRKLLSELRHVGNKARLETAVVTFDPIPRSVISPRSAPPLICSLQMRLDLLELTGYVDYCCVLPFDERMRRETAEEFVVGNLVNRLGMRILVVGENFACGRGRIGDITYLSELGPRHGFSVESQPLHVLPGLPRCSSTEARRLIQLGRMAEAACLLDREHELTGIVLEDGGSEVGNVIRVAIDGDLCAPPKDDYHGAVRAAGRMGFWREAVLKVCDAAPQGSRTVRLISLGNLCAKPGDSLTIRFAQRASFDT